ncbi:hypothetical protein NDU88_005992 [Pleurodeles waltl]|uniref:Uncharacterized protein n=1 Tax=Pleurodeles waltl TaxID=8319 RepID=A0AAV7TC90_PLEWA|nr:hypothetical protein NDU88_005992 [Pleurodeles waltl]
MLILITYHKNGGALCSFRLQRTHADIGFRLSGTARVRVLIPPDTLAVAMHRNLGRVPLPFLVGSRFPVVIFYWTARLVIHKRIFCNIT